MGHSDARRRGSEEVCGDPSSDMQTQQGGGGVLKDCKTPTSHAVAQGGDMHQCSDARSVNQQRQCQSG